ncbi:MAG TPA: arabinofuranosyltransferase, partial [Solirubrobacteraceae bacterium]|nr:arabinofuranosyltransferase [Solirubrobacteraceae bacterium]
VAGVLAGTALYQLGSVASLVVAHDQWQPHRAATMMAAAFGAAVPVALAALRSGGTVVDLLAPPLRRALVVAALALAVPAVFALGARQGTDEASGPLVAAAHRPLHLGTTDALSRFITRESGRAPQELTVLSADKALLVTRPYFGFLPLRARYAHPEADLPARVSVVARAAACRDPACTTRVLAGSRFGPVDALVLTRVPSGYRVETEEDRFPEPRVVSITFRRAAFAPAAWSRRDVGVFTAFVRRRAGYSVPNSRSPASPSPGRM